MPGSGVHVASTLGTPVPLLPPNPRSLLELPSGLSERRRQRDHLYKASRLRLKQTLSSLLVLFFLKICSPSHAFSGEVNFALDKSNLRRLENGPSSKFGLCCETRSEIEKFTFPLIQIFVDDFGRFNVCLRFCPPLEVLQNILHVQAVDDVKRW